MFEVRNSKFLYCFFILSTFVLVSEGKVYDRCDLAKDLLNKYNFKRAQIADWVCLAFSESTYNTSALGSLNSDGSHDHGLFQINDRYWCSPPEPINECNVNCQSLLDDDIADDVKCARLIYQRHGFSAWYGWVYKCSNRDLSSYVKDCDI